MAIEHLVPVSKELREYAEAQPMGTIGRSIQFLQDAEIPEFAEIKFALITVDEVRGVKQSTTPPNPDLARKGLYELYEGNWSHAIMDLGHLEAGNELSDTYYAIGALQSWLRSEKVIPIILGGGQDLTYALYRHYDNSSYMVNVTSVDTHLDLAQGESSIHSRNYVNSMIIQEPYNLYNYTCLGYQTFHNAQDELALLDQLMFDGLRLGKLKSDVTLVEPYLRDSDIVSIDLDCLAAGSVGAMGLQLDKERSVHTSNPNGLDSMELCSIARYAGISDRVGTFYVASMKGENPIEASLISQLIWYFMEGVEHRTNEYPVDISDHFVQHIVQFVDSDLKFYRSKVSGRWWVEIPFAFESHTKLKRHTLVPCSQAEYDLAVSGTYPDRYLRARSKNEI